MEGSYLPGKQRLKLAQQGRKSHFVFGKTNGGFGTTQNRFYKSIAPRRYPRINPGNRTASHFALGSDYRYKTSEFNSNFHPHPLEPKKPKGKIIDLTPSSVVMGMQKMQFSTSNCIYNSVSPHQAQAYSNSPNKNRKHNYDLGTDAPVKSSVMHSDFSPVHSKPTSKIDQGLLDSHIVMGGHPHMYISVASKEFSPKRQQPGSLGFEKVSDLKKEHFILGQDKPTMMTHQQDIYKPLLIPKQGLSKAQLENLKNSHFTFKAENPDYLSINKLAMSYAPSEIPGQEKYLKTNHVIFGDDKKKFSTSYSNYHTYRSQSVNEPIKTKNDELHHDIILGVTNPALSSTSNSFFTGEKAIPGRLDPQREKNLRGHHYSLGNSSNIYEQSHKNYGVGPCESAKLQESLKEDMNSTHWVNGYHTENLTTYTQRTYQPKVAEKREIEKYLKKHNYAMGDSKNEWGSSYTGKFKWIQPVPDYSNKFSFD